MAEPSPTDITLPMVNQYRSNVLFLAQQRVSRLWRFVQLKEQVRAEALFFERIGEADAMQDVTTRHPDTPNMAVPHSRRMVTMQRSNWAKLLDKGDEIRVIIDPASAFTKAGAAVVGHRKDKHIIDAMVGNAYGGKAGQTAIALPAKQKIVANNTGMTMNKLVTAREMFDENEIGTDDMGAPGGGTGRVLIIDSKSISELLNDTKVGSADYNTVKAIQAGTLNEFHGFTFVRMEPRRGAPSTGTAATDDGSAKSRNKHGLPYNATTDVCTCIAFYGPSLGLAIGQMDTFKVTQESTKCFAWQVFCEMDLGATRVEEEGVVLIDNDLSPAV